MTVKRVFTPTSGGVPVKIWTDDIEIEAVAQLSTCARMPFIHHHIAAMPDVHWGLGSTVGSVIPTVNAIIPAAVGVDIGCGMMAHRLNLRADELPDNLAPARSAIEAAVPHGRTDHGGLNDRGAWGSTPEDILRKWGDLHDVDDRFYKLAAEHPALIRNFDNRGSRQLGTLGTGNHFIELCVDTVGGVWVMLHSGSRGVGNQIGQYFIEKAKREMEKWYIHLPDSNLAYLPEGSEYFRAYVSAVGWAQDYAALNREIMMGRTIRALASAFGRPDLTTTEYAVNCHHNYVAKEHHYGRDVWITRKGAVRARSGDLGIIPGSMGARSFIVRGRGNPESFDSCSHGAGRRLSRREARETYNTADLATQTQGVECRKDEGVIDEIPGAYKDIQQVMDNQSDLVEILFELKQVICVKG